MLHMKDNTGEKRNVTVNDTIKNFRKNGEEISEKEAEKIWDFLYFLGKLFVNQYIKDDSSIQ